MEHELPESIAMKTTELRDAQVDARKCVDVAINLIDGNDAKLHQIRIEPDSDLAERFAAVNYSIVNDWGWPALSADDWAKVEAECVKLHTNQVKAEYAKWKTEQEALATPD